jgi:hypothetical protein
MLWKPWKHRLAAQKRTNFGTERLRADSRKLPDGRQFSGNTVNVRVGLMSLFEAEAPGSLLLDLQDDFAGLVRGSREHLVRGLRVFERKNGADTRCDASLLKQGR